MHKLLYFGLIMVVVGGCKQDNEETPAPGTPPPPPTAKAKNCQLLSETIDGRPYRTYQYTGDSTLFRIAQYETTPANREEKRYTFKYDAQGRVATVLEVRLVAPFVNSEYRFHYDKASTIDTVRQFGILNSGNKPVDSFVVAYDKDNRVNSYCGKSNCWRYEYDGVGNLSKWLATIPSRSPDEFLVVQYTNFDEKKGVYALSEPTRVINLISGAGNSTNNPGAFSYHDGSVNAIRTGVITYNYNKNELPTEATVSQFTASNSAATTQVYKYKYDCP